MVAQHSGGFEIQIVSELSCPSVADGEIGIRVCPLSMGNRENPARLVFTSKTGPAAMGIESVVIDKDTTIRNFKNELRWNEAAYR